jgi:hypothetical protein
MVALLSAAIFWRLVLFHPPYLLVQTRTRVCCYLLDSGRGRFPSDDQLIRYLGTGTHEWRGES